MRQDNLGLLRSKDFSRIIKTDPSGFNEVEVLCRGKWIKNTNFPDNWSHDQIMKCVFEIYDKQQIVRTEGIYTIIEGAFVHNIDIRIVINHTNGKCRTFYPVMK